MHIAHCSGQADHFASASTSLDVSQILGRSPSHTGMLFKHKEANPESTHPATSLIGLTLGATIYHPFALGPDARLLGMAPLFCCPLKLFQWTNPKPAHPPHLFLPVETTIKSLAHVLSLLHLPLDQLWCFRMWPTMAWCTLFSWDVWVANSFWRFSSPVCWLWHTWVIFKPIKMC